MKPLPLLLLSFLALSMAFQFREVQQVNQTSKMIRTLTNNSYLFDRTNDNSYTSTNYNIQAVSSNPIQVQSNATVRIVFPAAFTLTSNVTCLSIAIDSVSVNTFTCSISGNTVTFGGVFGSISNLFVGKVQLTVGNILNPSPAIPIYNFTGFIGTDFAAPAGSSSTQLTPGYFQNCSITFDPGVVNFAASTMIISLTPNDPHKTGTTLKIVFPKSSWTNDISNQALPIIANMACTSYSGNINTGIKCVGTSSNNLITVSNIFSTTVSDPFSFAISSFLSPPSNQPSDAIVLTSYEGEYELDSCTVYPSGLSPAVLTNFTIVPLSTMTVNSLTTLRFNIFPTMTLSRNDYINITIPTGTSFSYSNIFGTGFYRTPPTFSGQSVLIYHNTSSSLTYPQNALYSITFQNIQAPPSTLPTSSLILQVLRSGFPIMQGSSVLTAVRATLTAIVALANLIVWATTSYTFTINLNHPLSSAGMIRISFPTTVTPPNSIACATILGSNFQSQPSCSFDSASNSILLTSLNASSSMITAQTGIKLTVSGVLNPPDISATSAFTITTYYTSSVQGIVESGTIAGVTCIAGTIAIGTISIIPSSFIAMQSGITYTISFVNTYSIPQGGTIVIRIPVDIAIVTALIPNYCKASINGGSMNGATCSDTTAGSTTYYEITFTSPASVSSIAAGSTVALQLSSICTNPTNTRIVTNFAIYTYSSTALIQLRTTGITVQMTTPAPFTISTVSRVSQQNSALTTYTATLKQVAAIPSSTILLITLPTQLSLSVNSTCTDLSGVVLSCTQGSYTSLQVSLNAVGGNSIFGIIITNIRNPSSYKPTSSFFSFMTKTADLVSSYASGSVPIAFTNSVPSIFQHISYSFFPGSYGSSQAMTISLTPSAFAIPSSLIISLAGTFIIQNISCSSFIGFTGFCSQIGSSMLNISGVMGSSQITFTISGFTSPSYQPNDYTFISSYDSFGFLIDQDTSTIKYSLGCLIPCKTCTSNSSSCLSCYSNPNITSNILYYSANFSCLSSCPSSFYASSSLVCLNCSSTCLTCVTTSSNCTSCNLNSSFPALNISGNIGTCLSSCPLYYYLSTSISPSQCVPCVIPCLACTAINICLSCTSGYYYYNNGCSPTCPSNITIANAGARSCDACSPQCATCSGSISTCTSCSSTAANYNGACVTQCPSPLVISAGLCTSCDVSCQGCYLNSYNCTACSVSSSKPYLLVSNISIGSCLAVCPFTYYADSAQGLCKLCSSLNIGCKNCSSTISCYNCDFGSGLVFYFGQCLSITPTGYYNDSGNSKACNPACSSCTSLAVCTSCVSLSLSNSQCVANCPPQQVSVNKNCTSCTYPCLTCFNIPTNCTSCNSNISNPYFLSSGVCDINCPIYTYPNPVGWICSPCISPCETCSQSASCSSCVNGYYLFNQTCKNTCPFGYVGLNRACTGCTDNCLSCSGSTSNCLSCISGTYLYGSSSFVCSSTCPFGLFPNNISQSCTGCQSPCKDCSNYATVCTSCNTGYLLQQSNCVISCSTGYYSVGGKCLSCNSSCTKCSSATLCTACTSPLILSGSSCVSQCPASKPIINSANQCSSCTDINCVSCDSTNICSKCYYPKLLFVGSCISNCPANYKIDQNFTTCIYSPPSNNSATNQTLSATLQSSSVFPVPFTIGAAFLFVACLMSKFQNNRTDLSGSLYSLWGLLQWGAIAFLLVYYWSLGGQLIKLSYLLVAGGMVWLYLLNLIFILIQGFSLRRDKRFGMWLDGSVNSCWYGLVVCFSFLTTTKFKFIIFSKLFNFRSLSAKLDDIGALRVFHAFTFISILSSVAVIAGGVYFVIDSNIVVNQLLMAYLDVIIITFLELIIGLANAKKEADYFDDIDEDGFVINKRIQMRDQDFAGGVMPQFDQLQRKSYLGKGYQSAKKLQALQSQSSFQSRSFRDISIQAQSILGERSLISRLGTQTISQLSFFDKHDISIQMDPIKDMEDVSIGMSAVHNDISVGMSVKNNNDVSIGQSVIFKDASMNAYLVDQRDVSIDQTQRYQEEVSVQMQPQGCEISVQFSKQSQHEISVQYVPIYTDQTVHMTHDEQQFGIQCEAEQQNISIQYSAKPLIERVDDELRSQSSLSLDGPSDLDLQRRLIFHPPAPQEVGMKVELELDINEKLEKKRRELEFLQQERREKQRKNAIASLKEQMDHRQTPIVQLNPLLQGNRANEKDQQNMRFQNSMNEQGSLIRTDQEHSVKIEKQQIRVINQNSQSKQIKDFGKKQIPFEQNESIKVQPKKQASRELQSFAISSQDIQGNRSKQIVENQMFNHRYVLPQTNKDPINGSQSPQHQQSRQINNYFNNDNDGPSSFIQTHHDQQQNSRLKTQQQFIELLEGQKSQTNQQKPKKIVFQTANNIIENYDDEIIDDQELVEQYEPLKSENADFSKQAEKTGTTIGYNPRRPPLPKKNSNVLQSSQNSIQKSSMEEDEIVSRPLQRRKQQFAHEYRNYNGSEEGNKTNLTQFLQKKKRTIGQKPERKHYFMDYDDALSKQVEHDFNQRPLPLPSQQLFIAGRSMDNLGRGRQRFQQRSGRQGFDNHDDMLSHEAQKTLSRKNSKKKLQSQVAIEIPPRQRPRGYLKETFTSEQKRKSLQKIYLNKIVKR